MLNYSCAGMRPSVALSPAAMWFPKIAIVSASLLAFGLFYPTRLERNVPVCLIDCDLALLPGQSFRFPTISIAPVTLFVQVTFETAGYIETVCIANCRHGLGRSQTANAGPAQKAKF